MIRLAERYGVDELLAVQDALLDHTERLTRLGIRAMPEGRWTFTDYVDDDGFGSESIQIVTNLTKKDDEIFVDFTGTSPQVTGAINPPFDSTKAMVYAVVRSVLGGDMPNTGGYFRPVHVTAPPGTFVSPQLPAPVAARYLGCLRVSQSVFGAFAQMLPDVVPACPGGCDANITMAGYHRDGLVRRAWVQVEGANEIASGASATRDGMDAQSSPISNITNIPSELIEVEHPIRIEEYALVPDSEGAGKFRGGVGLLRHYRFIADETLVQLRSDRMRHPPYGLHRGQSGASSAVTFVDGATGEKRAIASKFIVTAKKGDGIAIAMPGGGGWGDPLERDPQRVLDDVIEEKISRERAESVYGVVVRAHGRTIELDAEATARLRTSRQGSSTP